MAITWQDAEDIAIALAERYPDTDPLDGPVHGPPSVGRRPARVFRRPEDVDGGELEAIQMAWLEEYPRTSEGGTTTR